MRFLLVFIVTLCLAVSAQAEVRLSVAPSCYTKQEAEAEQGIRIHSELMIIGLNCQHMTPPGRKNFYAQYRDFTTRNSGIISGYENTLINYYERAGRGNPVGALNDMRTAFANEISHDAAQMRPDIFCAKYVQRLDAASKMSGSQVRKWAGTFYPTHPLSRPICH